MEVELVVDEWGLAIITEVIEHRSLFQNAYLIFDSFIKSVHTT